MKSTSKRTAKPLMSQLAISIIERVHSQNKPAGSHLAEQELADAFHVSRGPVHEALMSLERKGIVIFHPNRGFFSNAPQQRFTPPILKFRYPRKKSCITGLPSTVSRGSCTVTSRRRS